MTVTIKGSSFSPKTVIRRVHVDVSPAESLAVYWTSCGVELTTKSLLCAPALFVMVGCWPLLSTAEAAGIEIVLVGLPGSVAVEMDWGHVIVGGRTSERKKKDKKDKKKSLWQLIRYMQQRINPHPILLQRKICSAELWLESLHKWLLHHQSALNMDGSNHFYFMFVRIQSITRSLDMR